MVLSLKSVVMLRSKVATRTVPDAQRKVHLELLEDRTTPSAGLFVPPPASLPAAEAMASYISAQPRSQQDLRLLYGNLRQSGKPTVQGVRAGEDVTPPAVANIEFGSSSWTNEFLQVLGNPNGFAAETGANQLKNLPWGNLDTIRVTFTEDVNIAADSFLLNGVNTPSYSIANFSYNPATFTATWGLGSAINTDKLVLRMDGTGIAQFGPHPVTDIAGNRLQGTWVDGQSSFPSGDGTPGVDFQYRFNVAPGDIDRSGGPVTDAELQQVRTALFRDIGFPEYSVFRDLDGSGQLRNADMNVVRNHIGIDLPSGEPLLATRPGTKPVGANQTVPTPVKPTRADFVAAMARITQGTTRKVRGQAVTTPAQFATLVDAVFATGTP